MLTKWFIDLKFKFKVGGGFVIVLVLAAVIGAVGYFTIANLSSRFEVVGRSIRVATDMQATSLQRESYLLNPGSESADAARQKINALSDALDALSEGVARDADALAKVGAVKATIGKFASTFDNVTSQTSQQAKRLVTLQQSVSNLESLAASISKAVGKEETRIRIQADAAGKELGIANQLLSSAVEFQSGAKEVKDIQNKSGGTFLGDFLPQATKVTENIVHDTERLKDIKVGGLDPQLIPKLAKAAKVLDQSLNAIGKTDDFQKKFEAQTAVGKTVTEIIDLTQAIQSQVFPLVDAAMKKATASSATLSQFGEVTTQAETLHRLALGARAETLTLFGNFGEGNAQAVEDKVEALTAVEKSLASAATALPSLSDQVKQIPISIATFDKAFQEMLVARTDLAKEREQLSRLTIAVSTEIDALNNGQIDTAQHAAESAVLQIAITILLAIAGGIGLAIILNLAISRPIQAVTDVIRKLAGGENDVAVPGVDRGDEIGIMAKAVQVLRANALEKIDLEHRAEANRLESEADRSQREQEKAYEAAKLQRTVNALAEGLGRLAAGDISADIGDQFGGELDRLRMDFNTAQSHLRAVLSVVERSATSVRTSTRELDAAVNDLSRRTEQQAASLEETSAALEEITETVKASTDRATEAGDIAAKTTAATARSMNVVRNAISAMAKIEQSSEKIRQIISVMDDIAYQTNLLALNAGVEAARAGETGKGFAVVAQEVRELAARSASAAKEITALINTSNSDVSSGVALVTESGDTLKEIEKFVGDMYVRVNTIVGTSKEQFASLSSVSAAVNSMDHATQQNAAMVEQASAVTASLSQEAERLHDGLAEFELGQKHGPSAPGGSTAAKGLRIVPSSR